MLNIEDLNAMNYNELIGIIGETNRPPGGIKTILNFIQKNNIDSNTKILEIGTSTGFTAIELAKLTNASITAIDINENSINIAKEKAASYNVEQKINFLIADAMNLPFRDEEFDIIFSGNIISYIPNRKKALAEYIRVLKNNGVLFASPMYYLEEPSEILIDKVTDALKMKINVDYEEYWSDFFYNPNLDLYYKEEYKFDYLKDKSIKSYVDNILVTNRKYLDRHINDKDVLKHFSTLYENYIYLFRDNLNKMGYTELYFRKNNNGFDEELFTSKKIGG